MGAEKETKKGKGGNKSKTGDKPGGDKAAANAAAPEPKPAAEPKADEKPKADDAAAKASDKPKAGDGKPKADDKSKADDKPKADDEPKAADDKAVEPEPAPNKQDDKAAAAPEFAELIPPNQIPKKSAKSKAAPPGPAPRGDSRSFRRAAEAGEEFCLIYRLGRSLIERVGEVGKLGNFEVTEYPSQGAAAHAYAQRCSELAADGYRDLPRP